MFASRLPDPPYVNTHSICPLIRLMEVDLPTNFVRIDICLSEFMVVKGFRKGILYLIAMLIKHTSFDRIILSVGFQKCVLGFRGVLK